jgi:adenylate cyclase
MVEVIFDHGGTLDKYLGDGLMAYFGAPLPQADHAARAVRCALAMQSAFQGLGLGKPGLPPLRLSIGLHTGVALIGVMGARNRREFTAVGDTVNLASRMETLTRDYGADVILSGETARRTGADLGVRLLAKVKVKGRSEPVEVFAAAEGRASG